MNTLEADELTENTGRQERSWGFFNRRFIGDGQSLYLDRLTILLTPWFSIKLHRIHRPDNQRDLHDHPWSFLSIVLLGSYVEDVPPACRFCEDRVYHDPIQRRVRWFNWKRATDSHSIRELSRHPVWTLVFTGPRRRVWGFHTASGWIPWHLYDKEA